MTHTDISRCPVCRKPCVNPAQVCLFLYVHAVCDPNAHFPVLLSTLIRSQFQVKPATLLIPVDIFFGTRYYSGSFCLIIVGSGFRCLRDVPF
jgi:hypothetical protein